MPVCEIVEPAFRWVPGTRISSTGQEAIDLCGEVGLPLDPEQEMALDAILAEKRVTLPSGEQAIKWAGLEACIVAPRQNIKTHTFKAITVTDLWLLDAPLVTWTAHEFATAEEAFLDFLALIDESPILSRRVKPNGISKGKGDQGIELTSGARLEFRARTKTGGRGLTGTRVILDEAFALRPSHVGSLLPTMAAKSITGNPQILYGSSAGQVDSGVLRAIRDRGRAGCADPEKGDPSLVYIEWCAPEGTCELGEKCDHLRTTEGCAADDMGQIAAANLALNRRISVEYIEGMRRAMPPEEFVREFLGWWDEPIDAHSGLDMEKWEQRGDLANPTDPVALAVDVTPGHSSGCISSYGDIAYVAEHGPGVSWIPSKLASLKRDKKPRAIGIDANSPAAALVPTLEKPITEGGAGLSVRTKANPSGDIVLLSGREMSAACELLVAGVNEGGFHHRKQAALTTAAESAYMRQMGDNARWSRRDSTADICPLVATTIAFYLWSQARKGAAPLAVILGGSK